MHVHHVDLFFEDELADVPNLVEVLLLGGDDLGECPHFLADDAVLGH